VLTEIEDSIIEDDAFHEEEPLSPDIQSIQIEPTTLAVTEEVTHEDLQDSVMAPVTTSQVDLKSSTVEAWNQQLNQDLNNTQRKKKRKTEQLQMRKTQKFKQMLLTDYGLVDKEESVGSKQVDFEDIKVQHVGLGQYQPSQGHLQKQ
jgi:hypothetical protein